MQKMWKVCDITMSPKHESRLRKLKKALENPRMSYKTSEERRHAS